MEMNGKATWSQPTLQKLALKDAENGAGSSFVDGTSTYS